MRQLILEPTTQAQWQALVHESVPSIVGSVVSMAVPFRNW